MEAEHNCFKNFHAAPVAFCITEIAPLKRDLMKVELFFFSVRPFVRPLQFRTKSPSYLFCRKLLKHLNIDSDRASKAPEVGYFGIAKG